MGHLNLSCTLRFVWSEVFKNDDAFLAHLVNPPVGAYLEVHAGLCDGDLSIEFYGTVGDKVIEAMNAVSYTHLTLPTICSV